MDTQEYCLHLGKLVANLHSLEFALRAFLLKHNEQEEPRVDVESIAVGRTVPENSFTNYDSLGTLIQRFNDAVSASAPGCSVEPAVVEVRDMLAHGRIASRSPDVFPMELVKFGKPTPAGVPVTARLSMDLVWLRSQVSLVSKHLLRVVQASKQMGHDTMETI